MTALRDLPIVFLSSEEAWRDLARQNLALRQQLAVATRSHQRPRLRSRDRFVWVMLSRLWKGWRSALVTVKPDTVVGWHRKGFKLYWRWRSRKRPGPPPIDPKITALIRRMAEANPLWGAPRATQGAPLQRHRAPDRCLDRPATRGGIPAGYRASLPVA